MRAPLSFPLFSGYRATCHVRRGASQSRAAVGALTALVGIVLLIFGLAGTGTSLSVAVNGTSTTDYIVLPASVQCSTGSVCSFQGQYTVNGLGSEGSYFGPSTTYTLGSFTETSTDSNGFFTVDLPSQPAGAKGTLSIPIPGTLQTASAAVTWSSAQTVEWTVTTLFNGNPVSGVQVTASVPTLGSVGVAETNSQGEVAFQLPEGAYYPSFTAIEACGPGVPTSSINEIAQTPAVNGGSVTIQLQATCSVTTQTQTATTTQTVVTSTGANGQTTTYTTTATYTPGATTLTVTQTVVSTSVSGAATVTATQTQTTTVTHTSASQGSSGSPSSSRAVEVVAGLVFVASGYLVVRKKGSAGE